MTDFNPWKDLRWIVECDYGHAGMWEAIAAFNDDTIAEDYAKRAKRSAPDNFKYQIRWTVYVGGEPTTHHFTSI